MFLEGVTLVCAAVLSVSVDLRPGARLLRTITHDSRSGTGRSRDAGFGTAIGRGRGFAASVGGVWRPAAV